MYTIVRMVLLEILIIDHRQLKQQGFNRDLIAQQRLLADIVPKIQCGFVWTKVPWFNTLDTLNSVLYVFCLIVCF